MYLLWKSLIPDDKQQYFFRLQKPNEVVEFCQSYYYKKISISKYACGWFSCSFAQYLVSSTPSIVWNITADYGGIVRKMLLSPTSFKILYWCQSRISIITIQITSLIQYLSMMVPYSVQCNLDRLKYSTNRNNCYLANLNWLCTASFFHVPQFSSIHNAVFQDRFLYILCRPTDDSLNNDNQVLMVLNVNIWHLVELLL